MIDFPPPQFILLILPISEIPMRCRINYEAKIKLKQQKKAEKGKLKEQKKSLLMSVRGRYVTQFEVSCIIQVSSFVLVMVSGKRVIPNLAFIKY